MASLGGKGVPANNSVRKTQTKRTQLKHIISKLDSFENLSILIKSSPIFKNKLDIEQKLGIDIEEFILSYKYQDGNIPDKFFDEKTNLYEWYKTKNPGFKKLSELPDLAMPEFNQLLATITLNLFKTLIELKFPGRRKTMNSNYYNKMEYPSINYSLSYYNKLLVHYTNEQLSKQRSYSMYTNNDSSTEYAMLISLLNEISILNITDDTQNNYWSYKKIMEIYLTYIAYMSGIFIKNIGFIDDKQIDDKQIDNEKYAATKLCVEYINHCHQIYLNTPFILFPTFVQLNEIKVIKTLSAPIVNFYITYTRTMAHENIIPPCSHIEHDIIFHGIITHFHILKKREQEQDKPINFISFDEFKTLVYNRDIIVNIEKIYDTLSDLFNTLIEKLKPENPENPDYPEDKKKHIILLLFQLFHENLASSRFIFENGFEINSILQNMVKCITHMETVTKNKLKTKPEYTKDYEDRLQTYFNKDQAKELEGFLATIFGSEFKTLRLEHSKFLKFSNSRGSYRHTSRGRYSRGRYRNTSRRCNNRGSSYSGHSKCSKKSSYWHTSRPGNSRGSSYSGHSKGSKKNTHGNSTGNMLLNINNGNSYA